MSLKVKHKNQASGNGKMKNQAMVALGSDTPLMLHGDRSSSYAGMLRRLRELDRSQRETGQSSTATVV
jgi:hypothetical protein